MTILLNLVKSNRVRLLIKILDHAVQPQQIVLLLSFRVLTTVSILCECGRTPSLVTMLTSYVTIVTFNRIFVELKTRGDLGLLCLDDAEFGARPIGVISRWFGNIVGYGVQTT